MDIKSISLKLNDLARTNEYSFSTLQEIRNKHLSKSPRSWSPFAAFSIKEEYAFHAGGRKEFQFNIGEDRLNGSNVFRYGLAFALNEDRTLHNSKSEFKDQIERFNEIFESNGDFFKGFQMWYYKDRHFAKFYKSVRSIDSSMFQAENFIFIGKYLEKDIIEVSQSDLNLILETFDYLLPLYETVQFGTKFSQKRMARICWNDNGWVMPSGRYGKSKSKDTHEAKYGYGHEEWLFDVGKLIGGYHYGFLEPIGKQHGAYVGRTFDIWLYAINGKTKKRFSIGIIKKAEVIDQEKAEKIKLDYINKNWFNEMKEQIVASGANPSGFSNWKGISLFNIRFLPENVVINDPPIVLPHDSLINDYSRYTFAYFNEVLSEDEGDMDLDLDDFEEEDEESENSNGAKKKTYVRNPKSVEIVYLHDTISKSLTKELRKKFGSKNVWREKTIRSNRVDIIVRDKDGYSFYEIKTYPSLKTCVREAIGQLMEYCYWTDRNKAKKLIVVTQPTGDFHKAKVYFKHLRDTFGLPIFYQSFDHEKKTLSEIV